MSREQLADFIFAAGIGQLTVLVASALVPFRLNWKVEFQKLSPLHRQLYWGYGGYVVLSIVSLALISLFNAQEIAEQSSLARAFCLYAAVFWGVRLCLQAVLQVNEHLTTWWLKAGYHGLTLLFVSFTAIYGWAAFAGRG